MIVFSTSRSWDGEDEEDSDSEDEQDTKIYDTFDCPRLIIYSLLIYIYWFDLKAFLIKPM